MEANPAFCSLLGYSAEELRGMTVGDITLPEDHAANTAQREALIQGQVPSYVGERRYVTKRGALVWVRISVSPLYGAGGELTGLMGFAEDITSQRAAQQQLANKQEQLAIASRMGRLGAWQYVPSEHRVIWSDEICALHEMPPGYTPTVPEGIAFFTEPYRPTLWSLFKACALQGIPVDAEADLVTAKGRMMRVRVMTEAVRGAGGEIVHVQGVLQDITALKALQDRERDLAKRLAMTLDAISDAFFTTSRDWCFTFCNRRFEKMLNVRRETLLGKTMGEIFEGDVGGPFDRIFRAALKDRQQGHVEALHQGTGLWLDVSAYPTEEGMAVYLRDVSARKLAEAQILALNTALEDRVRQRTEDLTEANRALESFSYSVSHDLRGPLRAMSGFAHVLEKDYAHLLPALGQRCVNRIGVSAEKMGQLVDDLLRFSRQGRVQLKWSQVEMYNLATEALETTRGDFPLHFPQVTMDSLPPAEGDAAMLRQVWVNLIGNAFKFTGGVPQAAVHIGCDTAGAAPVYWVRDNGAGFDMAYVGKLFGVFERLHTESEFEGTGVGLAIVHQIIKRHGGKVWARGAVGQGATFSFTVGRPEG